MSTSTDPVANILPVKDQNIPDELKQRAQWVLWGAIPNAAGKLDKPPYSPHTGAKASTTNPDDWATFDEVWAHYQADNRWAGIGYVFAPDDPYVGIDLDNCRHPESGKATTDEARRIVKAANSYTEASPSGTGVKIIVRASLDENRRASGMGIEVYSHSRFFTITGHKYPGYDTISNAQSVVDSIIASLPKRKVYDPEIHAGYRGARVPADRLLDRATAAANGEHFWALWRGHWETMYGSQSEADAALARLIAFWTGPDRDWIDELFRASALYRPEKWDRADYRNSTLNLALSGLTDWFEWNPPTLSMNGKIPHDDDGPAQADDSISIEDFRAYMPDHKFIFIPSRDLWPAVSVNARLPAIIVGEDEDGKPVKVKPSNWLDTHRAVEQMTWAPGEPALVDGKLMTDGGWVQRPGCTVFNRYRPPVIEPGNASKADTWIEHIEFIYPDHYEHIIFWLAHRVQKPAEKINHALVLGGSQGIGKDTLLEPVKQAIGPWNFNEVTPAQMIGQFNAFVESVILRVSEARDLGDVNRYMFYDHMKRFATAPPDVIRVDQKYMQQYQVLNVCGLIITTNHLTGGLYLPADDRRHFVAWSERAANDFPIDHWNSIYRWYESGGYGHVAAYLSELDLSDFDPKAPPEKTDAFWDMVSSNMAPEDAEVSDILDQLGNPDAVTVSEIAGKAEAGLREWLTDRKNSRQIPHRMEEVGYVRTRNDGARDGLWKTGGKRQAIYARKELAPRKRVMAARELVGLYG